MRTKQNGTRFYEDFFVNLVGNFRTVVVCIQRNPEFLRSLFIYRPKIDRFVDVLEKDPSFSEFFHITFFLTFFCEIFE